MTTSIPPYYPNHLKAQGNKVKRIYYDYVQDILLSHFINHYINVVGGSMICIVPLEFAVFGFDNSVGVNDRPGDIQKKTVEMLHRMLFNGKQCRYCSIPNEGGKK